MVSSYHRSPAGRRPQQVRRSRDARPSFEPLEGRALFTAVISEDFSSGAAAFTPAGGSWAASAGTYQVTADNTAATTTLNSRSLDNTPVSGDFTLTADATALAAKQPWANFSVIFDYQDANNFYFFSSNQSNDAATSGIFKVAGGVSTELADVAAGITPDTGYKVRVERAGDQIRAYRNDVLLATATDGTFTSGKVGFGTRQYRATFDNLLVTTPDAPAPAVPAAPSALVASAASASAINLNWTDNSTDETGFEVERSTDGVNFTQVGTVGANVTSYAATGLAASTQYTFRVRATNAAGDSPSSNTASATTASPTLISEDFSTSAGNFTVVDGTWAASGGAFGVTANNQAATTHLNSRAVHRTGVAGDFTLDVDARAVAATAPWANFAVVFGYQDPSNYYFFSSNQSNDSGTSGIFKVAGGVSTELTDVAVAITPGVTYHVKVERAGSQIRAYRDGTLLASATDGTFTSGLVGLGTRQYQASFDNLTVTGTAAPAPTPPTTPTAPAAPSALAATAASSTQVNLTWSDNSTDETGFKIERSTAGGAWTQVATVGANVRAYSATGLAASTAYGFRVRATNDAGDSAYSNTVSATTPAATNVAKPDATNTGLAVTGKTEASLRVVSGSYTAKAGEVLDGVKFTGGVIIPAGADNVVIRNCLITGGKYGVQSIDGAKNLLVENTEIRGTSGKGMLIHHATVRRVYIHDVGSDGIFVHVDGDVLVEYSFITRCGFNNATDHVDGIQVHNPGSNIVIRYNQIYLPSSAYNGGWAGTWGALNSCIVFQSDWGSISNSTIQNNWLYGGGYTVRLEEKGGYEITGITVSGNRFGRDYDYGPRGTIGSPGFTWTNNVYDDNGQVIS
jgi:hypothetical protein